MIAKNEQEQWIGCTICGERVELRRATLANPETVLMMMEELVADHADCEQYKHDPRLAAMQRDFKVRMRAELGRGGKDRRRAPAVRIRVTLCP